MKSKKITGLVVLIIGVVLIIVSMYAKYRIGEIKGEVHQGTSLMSGNRVGKEIGNVIEGKASAYDTTVQLCLIGGIILVVVGGGIMLFSGKRKR